MDTLIQFGPLIVLYVGVFALGAVVGSMLNVCILRLPLEKSLIWPDSRCGKCLQSVRSWRNLPIIGWFLLGGRCGVCRQPYSIRYPLIELFTALVWVGLFHLELVMNWQRSAFIAQNDWHLRYLRWDDWPFWQMIGMWLHHAILVSFLIVAAVTDLDGRIIPLSVTVTGTFIGLIGSALFPWPWPLPLNPGDYNPDNYVGLFWTERSLGEGERRFDPNHWPPEGLYFWPIWLPLPGWLPPGRWWTGLATGLVGAAFGTALLRVVGALFSSGLKKEALGLGDADLMMMVGAFLGWQPVLVIFFVGAMVALVFAVPAALWRGENSLPFAPGLAVGTAVTWVSWPWLSEPVRQFLFDPYLTPGVGVLGLILVFVLAFMVGRARGSSTSP